jgi:hypothetical protein
MDESQGGGKKTIEELEALARLVAEFVGVEVREMGKHEE